MVTKKELDKNYDASAEQPALVDVPTLNYLRIDGIGDPNTSSAYKDAVEALFSLAYTIKFAVRNRLWSDATGRPVVDG